MLDDRPVEPDVGALAQRAGPLTVVPCDNLPGNGAVVRGVVTDLARQVDRSLLPWLETTVSFATTMVDRITPRTTADDVRAVAEESGADAMGDPECREDVERWWSEASRHPRVGRP